MPANLLPTIVKNTSGVRKPFPFLPPHGITLDADQTYSIDGDLLSGLIQQRPAYANGLAEALNAGDLEIVQSAPAVLTAGEGVAGAAADYDRAVKDREFWASLAAETSGRYADRVRVAEANLVKAHAAVKALFLTVAKGRTDAYSPGGQGIHDERDALVKVLEVWGVFDRLKHIGQGRPGVVGALHREAVKVEPGSGKVYFAEVDCSRVTSTRVVVCFTPMKAEGDLWVMLPVGLLTWDRGTHEVEMVYVPEDYRRRGIGRELWEYAKTKEPGLQHSSDRTNDGDAWARSVGGEVPERKGRGGDMRNASMLTLHLMGYGPQDVIGEVEQR
jgi:GNAT superfamily N-acetyltransferase